jgi:hypothetical protein
MLAVVVLCSLPLLLSAVEESLVGGDSAQKKDAFTTKECLTVVKKVQESKRYTEESIVPICNEEMRSGGCDFFAEALSLASSHSDFKPEAFCEDMDRAQFCSEIMDKLLESTAVSDLAFGECERAKTRPQKEDSAYCRKIKQMLAYSVENQDLDTMRACYMMEAYTNLTSSTKELEPSQDAPKQRIVTGSSKDLENVGSGKGPGHPPKESNIGRADIVLQPTPLENFGKTHDKGNLSSIPPAVPAPGPVAVAAPAAAGAASGPAPSILAKPIPAAQLQKSKVIRRSSPTSPPTAERRIVPQVKASSPSNATPVILQATVMMPMDTKGSSHPMLIAQPLTAQAIWQNGTLVMTGAPFGTVVVDQHGMEAELKKQAATAAAKPSIKAPAAPVQHTKAVEEQPGKVKTGFVTVQPKPVAEPKVAIPAVVIAQPAASIVAIAAPKVAPTQTAQIASVPAQPVAKTQVVAFAQPAPLQQAKPEVRVATPPVPHATSAVVNGSTAVAPMPAAAIAQATVPVAQASAPVVQAAAPVAPAVVPVVRSVAASSQIAKPVAVTAMVAQAAQVKVAPGNQPAGPVHPAAQVASKKPIAAPAKSPTIANSKVAPAQESSQVTGASKTHSQGVIKAPAPSAVVKRKQSIAASAKSVQLPASKKNAVLMHASLRVTKAHVQAASGKTKGGKAQDKSDYSGFLSKFVGV